jgi:rRNA-processing protein FCF1
LLRLVNVTLSEEDIEFDEYNESMIQNHAHQVIYKSVVRKLQSLRERKREFADESARLYLEDYEKYKAASTG